MLYWIAATATPVIALPWARADEPEPLLFKASQVVQSDANLFRLPAGAAPAAGGRSERLSATALGLAVDKGYGLQRFQFEGGFIAQRYAAHDYLDFDAAVYSAAWQWSLTPRVRGSLRTDRKVAPISFADYRDTRARNLRTERTVHFDAEGNLMRAIQPFGSVDHTRRADERPVLQLGDASTDSAAVGVRWMASSGSSVSVRVRSTRGDYGNGTAQADAQLAREFNEQAREARVDWAWSSQLRFGASLGHVRREHPGYAAQDFRGPVGDAQLTWQVSPKLEVRTVAAQELNAYQTAASNHERVRRHALAAAWQVTPHTNVTARLDKVRRDFHDASATVQRRDRFTQVALNLEWQPLRNVGLGLSLQRLRNASDAAGFGYSTHIAGLTARLAF